MRNLRTTLAIIMLAGVATILSGCVAESARKPEEGYLTATVSIPPQEYLLKQIAGDRVTVNCLLQAGADPENYEPSMSRLIDLQESQIYFTLGGLPFEEALMERIKQNMPDLKIADSSKGISFLADHCHGHAHNHEAHHHHDGDDEEEAEGFDPHIWTSPANCRIIAANMTRSICQLDPERESYYRARLQTLDKELAAADDTIRRILSGCTNRVFMVWHPSMGYFAADYDLTQISVQQEGKEVGARQLADAIDRARRSQPAVLFYDIAQQGNETTLLSNDLQTPTYPQRLMDSIFLQELIDAAKAIRDNQKR